VGRHGPRRPTPAPGYVKIDVTFLLVNTKIIVIKISMLMLNILVPISDVIKPRMKGNIIKASRSTIIVFFAQAFFLRRKMLTNAIGIIKTTFEINEYSTKL
jgi:hypothetical protein